MKFTEQDITNISNDYLTRVAIESNMPSIVVLMDNEILSIDELSKLVESVESDNNAIPKEYLMKEALQSLRENHNLTIQTALAKRMESVANVIAPDIDPLAERIGQLNKAYSQEIENGSIEKATSIFNDIQDLSENGLPDEPEGGLPRMTASDVVARGVSFVTEYLNEFPEETIAVTNQLKRMS